MLEALGCWKVDWTAIGAVATAAATCVALGVVVRDIYVREVQRKRDAKVAKILLAEELLQLESCGEGWETAAVLVALNKGESEYIAEIRHRLLVPSLKAYLNNQIYISDDVVIGIATVVSLATIYSKDLNPERYSTLFKQWGAYETHFEALTAEVKKLREVLHKESESCW